MVRPRWHDVVIIAAILAILAVGLWALWWDDLRGGPGEQPKGPAGTHAGQT